MTTRKIHCSDDRLRGKALSPGDCIAFQILLFLAATLLLAQCAYLCGLGLSAFIPAAAFALVCLSGFAFPGTHGTDRGLSRLAVIAAFPAIVIVSLAVATFYFDVSFDGQLYRQDAILRLVQGWNPLLETGPSWYRKVSERCPKAG